jgi:dihydrofolate reductase
MKENNKMIRMIAAASLNGVIGQNNGLPWEHDYPEDMAFFRKMTAGSTVIMGRKTFESIGRPLPKRRNIVLTRRVIPRPEAPIEHFLSLDSALKTCEGDVWIIGGSFVYQEGLSVAQELYVTTIPKTISGEALVYFPYVNPDCFKVRERIELSAEKNLYCNVYVKKDV